MNLLIALFLLLPQAAAPDKVKQFSAKEIDTLAAKMVPGYLDKGEGYTVMVNRRTEKGQSELHEIDTDVFYVVDGTATFTTGGTIVGGKTTAPGEIRGTSIKGGKARKITKGDVLTIPHGTPHWFSDVQGTFTYMIIKTATGKK